jgi:recombinational DNA repair protein (RecF pathway)
MKHTILIFLFAAFMANNAKADPVEYQLSVYVMGVLKYTGIYSTMDKCIEAGSAVSNTYVCEPVAGAK